MKTPSSRWMLRPATWALLFFGGLIVLSHCRAQAQGWTAVINITNHIWKYLVEGGDQGTVWRQPEFDDSSWNSGIGLFGFESTPAVYPYPFQTVWLPIDGRLTYYARTHFHWAGNWPDVLLRTTNYIDDGAVYYLNGAEIGRVRMPTNIVIEFGTPAFSPPIEGRPDVLEFRTPFLRRGDNVLAVEIHNASPLSHDIVFGLSMEGIECHFDLFPRVTPDVQVVEECSPATITLISPPFFYPGMKWMKDGVPIPSATNTVLVIPHVSAADWGEYYVEIPTPCDPQQSNPSWLVVSPDITPPQPLRAVADSTLTNLIITFSEPLNAASVNATNFIVDDVCLPGGLKTDFASLVNPTNVLLITNPRRLDQDYIVTISGVRDACAGNMSATNTTIPLTPVLSLNSLRLTRSPAGLVISWLGCGALQWSSNLIHWADVPGTPASPYPADSVESSRFYRLRLP